MRLSTAVFTSAAPVSTMHGGVGVDRRGPAGAARCPSMTGILRSVTVRGRRAAAWNAGDASAAVGREPALVAGGSEDWRRGARGPCRSSSTIRTPGRSAIALTRPSLRAGPSRGDGAVPSRDLVLARALGLVERPSAAVDDVLGDGVHVLGQAGDAEARRDRPAVAEGRGLDLPADALGVQQRAVLAGLHEQDRELVAAVPADHVDAARLLDAGYGRRCGASRRPRRGPARR